MWTIVMVRCATHHLCGADVVATVEMHSAKGIAAQEANQKASTSSSRWRVRVVPLAVGHLDAKDQIDSKLLHEGLERSPLQIFQSAHVVHYDSSSLAWLNPILANGEQEEGEVWLRTLLNGAPWHVQMLPMLK